MRHSSPHWNLFGYKYNMDQAPTCALGPRALLSGLGVASTWNIPGLPLTLQDRHQLLKQLRAHCLELTLHLLGLKLRCTPPCCFLTGLVFVSLGAQAHPITQSSTPHTSICHCQPGEQLHSIQLEINRHRRHMRDDGQTRHP